MAASISTASSHFEQRVVIDEHDVGPDGGDCVGERFSTSFEDRCHDLRPSTTDKYIHRQIAPGSGARCVELAENEPRARDRSPTVDEVHLVPRGASSTARRASGRGAATPVRCCAWQTTRPANASAGCSEECDDLVAERAVAHMAGTDRAREERGAVPRTCSRSCGSSMTPPEQCAAPSPARTRLRLPADPGHRRPRRGPSSEQTCAGTARCPDRCRPGSSRVRSAIALRHPGHRCRHRRRSRG